MRGMTPNRIAPAITRRPLTAATALWLIVASALALIVVTGSPAFATGPPVTGAGSTWVQIALDQWRADYAHRGYQINYNGVGSSAGRNFYIINQVDFAATEIPFQGNPNDPASELGQLKAENKTFQYLPDVAGGTSLMYNLHNTAGQRITSLNLDSNAAALIFTGKINSWQDPAIARLNPGLQIRDTHITPVVRSDGSGTSAQFSLYLQNQQPTLWNQFVQQYGCQAPCSVWPIFPGATGQNGSDGVANFIANDTLGQGAIGYVEAGYAYGRNFPVGNLHNRSGHFVQPSSNNVATALTHATLNHDLTQNLQGVYNAPEANAYPMSSYSYMVTPTAEGFGFTAAKGAVLSGWIVYIACQGQQSAAPLGYSPLPKNLIEADFAAVDRIPGHVATPPIDYAHCPNPNLPQGGGGGSHTPPPSHGGSSTPPTGGSSAPSGGSTQPGSTTSGPSASSTTPAPAVGGVSGNQPPPGVQVTTMTQQQQQAAYQAALKSASYAQPEPIMPLVVTALGVLALVFAPVLLQVRRQTPEAPRSNTDRLRNSEGRGTSDGGG
jgi:phosphate ABC transporter phosphate-binding protein